MFFKRARSALVKGPLEFPSRKKGKRKYTQKEQLYWVKSQVIIPDSIPVSFPWSRRMAPEHRNGL